MRILVIALLCVLGVVGAAHAQDKPVPRTVVALYDGDFQPNIRKLTIHRFFEMPANHLGLSFEYHDIQKPLPELGPEVAGIIIGFESDLTIDATDYLKWLSKALDQGKRLAIAESMGIANTDALDDASLALLNSIYARIGVLNTNTWYPLTHKSVVQERDPEMLDFERKLAPPFRPFEGMRVNASGKSYLRMLVDSAAPDNFVDLVVIGPQGGFVAPGYAFHDQDLQDRYVTAWYINPFLFLRKALLPARYPAPDVTTRVGRRIFYSHIDGDGWNNMSLIEEYRDKRLLSAEVIEERIIKPYPDFGFSVGIIAADVVDACFGNEKSREVARHILAQPNVEVTNHTYTHPLYWQFYEDYTPEKEAPFAGVFPKRAGLFSQDIKVLFDRNERHHHRAPTATRKREREMTEMERLLEAYDAPRSYNCVPFDEETEIVGSAKVIADLMPPEKKISLMQWSGNTSPYERFLRKTREAGYLNINGGESRFDNEYPSYSSLFPIGVKVGEERQIYSSASNENTYTNLWSERFFGYRYLIDTVRHTELPLRVSPFNVYFHSYSGERPASLRALQEIMDYARQEELLPVYTSEFARIANGFYSTELQMQGPLQWRVKNRGALQTLRFDDAGELRVDFARSQGVLGERMYQDNLYIALNPSVKEPVLVLAPKGGKTPLRHPTLISSRWDVLAAEAKGSGGVHLHLRLQGFGDGAMQWRVPHDGGYEVTAMEKSGKVSILQVKAKQGQITFQLDGINAIEPVDMDIMPMKAARKK